jgi:hypothetical protein
MAAAASRLRVAYPCGIKATFPAQAPLAFAPPAWQARFELCEHIEGALARRSWLFSRLQRDTPGLVTVAQGTGEAVDPRREEISNSAASSSQPSVLVLLKLRQNAPKKSSEAPANVL